MDGSEFLLTRYQIDVNLKTTLLMSDYYRINSDLSGEVRQRAASVVVSDAKEEAPM